MLKHKNQDNFDVFLGQHATRKVRLLLLVIKLQN